MIYIVKHIKQNFTPYIINFDILKGDDVLLYYFFFTTYFSILTSLLSDVCFYILYKFSNL